MASRFDSNQDSVFSSDASNLPQLPQLQDNGRIADIIIAKNLNLASSEVQIQVLEVSTVLV
jgi:hypothetical protein